MNDKKKTDLYEVGKKQLKRDIKKFLKEQEIYFYKTGMDILEMYDEETNEG